MTRCKGVCAYSGNWNTRNINLKNLGDKQTSTHDMSPNTVSTACGGCKTNNFWEDLNSFVELSHKIMSYAKDHIEKSTSDESDAETETTFESESECGEDCSRYNTCLSVDPPRDNSCDFLESNDCGAVGADSGSFYASPRQMSTPRSGRQVNVNCGGNCCKCPVNVTNYGSRLPSPILPICPNISRSGPSSLRSGQSTPRRHPAIRNGIFGGSDPWGSGGETWRSIPTAQSIPQRNTATRNRTFGGSDSCDCGVSGGSDPWGSGIGGGSDAWGSGVGGGSNLWGSGVGGGSDPWGSGGGTLRTSIPAGQSSPRRNTGGRSGASGGGSMWPSIPTASVAFSPATGQESFEWVDPLEIINADEDPLYVNVDFDIVPNQTHEPAEWRAYESSFPLPRAPRKPMCTGTADRSHDDICELQTPTGSRSCLRSENSTFSTSRTPLYTSRSSSPRRSPGLNKTTPVKCQRTPSRPPDCSASGARRTI